MSQSKAEKANVHYQRALDLEKAGLSPIEEYSRGLALAPAEWAYQNRGWAYFRSKDFAHAVEDWNRVGDDYAKPRGRAKLELGDYDGAIADLTIALKNADKPDTRAYLEKAYAAKAVPMPAAKRKPAKETPPPPKLPARKKGEGYDAYVERALAVFGDTTRKAIAGARRTAFVLTTTKSVPKDVGRSRIGGLPDLPKGTKWPRAAGKPMSFIAQLRLDELATLAKTPLPRKGLLALFVSEEGDSYLEKCAVLHVDGAKLEPAPLPVDFGRMADGEIVKKPYKERGLAFAVALKLPSTSNPIWKKTRWAPGEEERYGELFQATLEFDQHQVLGFRDREYDAEQKATTALLFQCFSEGDMSWGDEDHLYFYIPDKALAAGDFAKAFPYSGD